MTANANAFIYCLTLRVQQQQRRADWLWLRNLQLNRPPDVDGLKARFWYGTEHAVVGHYLFESRASLEHYQQNLLQNTLENEPGLANLLDGDNIQQAVSELPFANNQSAFLRPIIILSAPRSGSTLLYELLEKADGVQSLNAEAQAIFDGIPSLNIHNHRYQSQSLNETHADTETAAIFRSCILAQLGYNSKKNTSHHNGPIRFLDKSIENALRIPFLKSVFPEARYVYLYRDLRQNVSSIVDAWKHTGFISIPNLPEWPKKGWCFLLPSGWEHYRYASLSEIAAFQWESANKAIIEGLETIERRQWTSVSYTNLTTHPEQEIVRLCTFAELELSSGLRQALSKTLPLSSTTLTAPSPIKWKSNSDFDPQTVKYLQPLAGRMRSLQSNTAPSVYRSQNQTRVKYACFADELTPTPQQFDLIVTPSLLAQMGNSVPLQLLAKTKFRERFLDDHPLLWWQDPATGVWVPIWLRTHQVWLCQQLRAGQQPPQALVGQLHDKLCTAGVLTTQAELSRRRQHGIDMLTRSQKMLERDLYCELPKCLPQVFSNALADYYNKMIHSGDWPSGDEQVERRHGWHNESIARFLHHQLTDFVSTVAGRPLKPTYTYSSAYLGSATLDAHTDREQCEYTLSLMVDEHIPEGGSPWPLWFHTDNGKRSLVLKCGDATLFRGCLLPHWREQASSQHRQTNLLFHFTPAEWAGVMD